VIPPEARENVVEKKAISGFVAERRARERLQRELRVEFASSRADRTLIVGHRSTGEAIKHEFDLVSSDGRIVGEIKSDKYTKRAQASTRLPRMLAASKYLELVSAERKLLVLTNRRMHKILKHDLDGIINKQIEVCYVDVRHEG
jgi:thiamine kinase-like enzyme